MKKLIFLLFSLVLLTGCSSDNELNVLNWSSYIPNEVIENFEKETNIKVNYGTYSSNEELLAKISSAKEGTYDLIFPSDYMVELMINKDIIQKIDLNRLSNKNNLNEKYLNLEYDLNNEYSLPFLATNTVIAVNKDNVKEEITSYNDLLNSKYKNDIVLIDDQRIIIGMALLACGYDMNDTSKYALNKAKDWLLAIKPNIKAFDSDSPKTFLISGEVNIGVLWNAEAAIALDKKDNIDIVYPKEGIAKSIDNFAIPKGARNIENTYKFIDYILRPEVMKLIVEDYPYKNINKNTDYILDNSYLRNKAANTDDDIMQQAIFVKNIGNDIKIYDKVWAEIK